MSEKHTTNDYKGGIKYHVNDDKNSIIRIRNTKIQSNNLIQSNNNLFPNDRDKGWGNYKAFYKSFCNITLIFTIKS